MSSKGYALVAKRFRTPFAEIDLLMRDESSSEWFVVEVKSSLWPDGQGAGLSKRQKARLSRALQWLESEISEFFEDEVCVSLILLAREDLSLRRVVFRILPMF
jgi:putative endonuclease